MFELIKTLYNKLKSRGEPEPVGISSFMWGLNTGHIIHQSAVFYMNKDDSKRKVVIHGTPPAGTINEDHNFYHRIIVPYMNKIDVNSYIKFKTKEDALNMLRHLSFLSELSKNMPPADKSPVKTSTEDNIIHVDFGNSLDDI